MPGAGDGSILFYAEKAGWIYQPVFLFLDISFVSVEDYGGEGQRNALKNLVNRAQTHEEAQGLLHAFQKMKGIDYELVNVSLHYRGNQGLDMIFKTRDGSLAMVSGYAVMEAKHGRGPEVLSVDAKGLEQGSTQYNLSRLKDYLNHGDQSQIDIAMKLLDLSQMGQLKSYASFYKGGSLYELKPTSRPARFNAVKQ